MSLKEENRRDVVLYRIERAYTAFEQAKLNLEFKCLEVKPTDCIMPPIMPFLPC